MTRSDFKLIASVLRHSTGERKLMSKIVLVMVKVLGAAYPNFDETKFITACQNQTSTSTKLGVNRNV